MVDHQTGQSEQQLEDALIVQLNKQGFEIVWAGVRGRYLRLNYLVSRLGGIHPLLGRTAGGVINGLGLAERAVPINFGDLFTVYGRKPLE